jgi:hypothetical protein
LHTGQADGTDKWAPGSGNQVGLGWDFDLVFATTTGDGVLYGVSKVNGDLLWYKHTGRDNGTFSWAPGVGGKVGQEWRGFARLWAADDGVIYGVDTEKNLRWYKHTGRDSSTFSWAPGAGTNVGPAGIAWPMTTMFSGASGRIYAISGNTDLQWYNHLGAANGTVSWTSSDPKVVGISWDFMPLPGRR